MDTTASAGNRLEALERLLKLIRDVFVFVGAVLLVVYFFPALDGLRNMTIQSLSIGPFTLNLLKEDIATFAPRNITLEAVSGPAMVLEKGSPELLEQAKARLQSTKGARIDVIQIVPGKLYSGELLQRYISLLSARFVVFQSQASKLEGWIDASGFAAQLVRHRTYRYEDFVREIVGISDDKTDEASTAKNALEKMQTAHLDNLAVVDTNGRFKFMVSRQDILSKVVTSIVLAQ
jgi:CBS domain-containing protein